VPRPRGVPLGVSRRQPLGLLQAEVSVALAHNLQAGHPPSAQVWCSRKRLRQRKGARLLYSKDWLSTLLTLLVSAAPGFGAASQPAAGGFGGAAFGAAGGGGGGTSICKWQRTQGADGQAGGTVSAQGNYMAITAMQQYQNFSFEELRVQDYEVCMLHDKQCNQRNPQLHSGRQASTTQLESITCDSWLLCAWDVAFGRLAARRCGRLAARRWDVAFGRLAARRCPQVESQVVALGQQHRPLVAPVDSEEGLPLVNHRRRLPQHLAQPLRLPLVLLLGYVCTYRETC
jgi:hypothetical protein